jgi:hypothetical protein
MFKGLSTLGLRTWKRSRQSLVRIAALAALVIG